VSACLFFASAGYAANFQHSYWYRPILSSENTFPDACRKVLVGFIKSLSTHMTRKRSADTFLQFVTNSSSMIIVFLNELSLALQATSPDSSSTEHYVREYLKKYPESNLANVLSIDQQQRKLKMVADDVLSNFLDVPTYQCEVVKNFLREVFAGVVLESVVKSCSQPDFINSWIVHLLKEGEPEIMNAIDAGLESASKGDIAALSGIAGHASQDLAKATPPTNKAHRKGPSRAEQEAAALHKPIRELSHGRGDAGSLARNDSLSSISMQGAIPSPSTEKPSGGDREETEEPPQQLIETTSYEQNLSETKNTEHDADDTTIYILYGASVLVDDGSVPGDKVTMKAKPTTEYMLQIEPASTRYPGWMIFRKYQDFEHLHKGLETLSRYHHVSFLETHASLPGYRDQTKSSLAKALERYLRDALEYKELATSERFQRFLDKDNELGQTAPTPPKTGLSVRASSTFENMGKGMLGVLSNAPKGVAGGGKAMFDGVSGVFGGVNRSRKSVDIISTQLSSSSIGESNDTLNNIQEDQDNASLQDNTPQEQNSPPVIDQQDQQTNESSTSAVDIPPVETSEKEQTADDSEEQNTAQAIQTSPESSAAPSIRKTSLESEDAKSEQPDNVLRSSETGDDSHTPKKEPTEQNRASSSSPITEDETRVAVELIFAVINELYTLSSAWNFRKTLLNAAKSYVLRPKNNPHLESIRALVQESMIDAHTTDEAIATNINKIRENSLPTEEEMKAWPPPLSKDESEKLKNEAKRLLIERGMPQVLMSVMGAAASGEALGKVFDCLQVEEVGRGFMFALILQALRAVIL
jgi:PXA domain/Sorting nexin C terminal/PX domain